MLELLGLTQGPTGTLQQLLMHQQGPIVIQEKLPRRVTRRYPLQRMMRTVIMERLPRLRSVRGKRLRVARRWNLMLIPVMLQRLRM